MVIWYCSARWSFLDLYTYFELSSIHHSLVETQISESTVTLVQWQRTYYDLLLQGFLCYVWSQHPRFYIHLNLSSITVFALLWTQTSRLNFEKLLHVRARTSTGQCLWNTSANYFSILFINLRNIPLKLLFHVSLHCILA